MIPGLDVLSLGHPKFPLKALIKMFPVGWAGGCFADVFASYENTLARLRKLLDTGKPRAWRLQLDWDANHNRKQTIIGINKLKQMLPACEMLAKDYPGIQILVSHTCEYSMRDMKEVNKRNDLVFSLAPSCTLVQNPLNKKAAFNKSRLVEWHGDVAAQIVSMDGTDISEINVKQWLDKNKSSLICFGWTSRFNFREAGEKTPPPPKKRTNAPTPAIIKNVITKMKG